MRVSIIILFCFLFYTKHLIAQPFSSIEIGTSVSNSYIIDENYSDRWYAENKLTLSISTPFYIGHLRAYIDLIDYDAKINSVNSFTSENYALALVSRFNLNRNFYTDIGGSFGIQRTVPVKTEITSNDIERELFYGILLESGIQTKYALFFGSLEYRKIYNYNRQHIYFLGGGMRIRLFIPEKIQRFID